MLYAVSDDPRVQGAIIEACEAALRSTLGWLEREVVLVRRGTGNERWLADLAARDPAAAREAKVRLQPARGMAAAVFRHRTSRAGDPLLHWHVLVPNLVEGVDGRWSALVHPELYRHARAAGEVFQAAVRAEATARLGVAWRPGRHVPEVAGVPEALCERFSKRSRERDAWLAATGAAGTRSPSTCKLGTSGSGGRTRTCNFRLQRPTLPAQRVPPSPLTCAPSTPKSTWSRPIRSGGRSLAPG